MVEGLFSILAYMKPLTSHYRETTLLYNTELIDADFNKMVSNQAEMLLFILAYENIMYTNAP